MKKHFLLCLASAFLLVVAGFGLPLFAQSADQSQITLPFQLVQLQGSALLMKEYLPATSYTYNPQDKVDGTPVDAIGQFANFVYSIPANTFPAQIISSYQTYLESQGYKVVRNSWNWNKGSICSAFNFCGYYQINNSYHRQYISLWQYSAITVEKTLIMENSKPEGNSIVALSATQLKVPVTFFGDKEQKQYSLVDSKLMNPGENILLLSVSWPQSKAPSFVQADPGLSKAAETPAVPATPTPTPTVQPVATTAPVVPTQQPETAAIITKELHDNGKINIYGLHFDFNKAVLKSDSATTLTAITEALQNDPKINVLIIGHTDNVGGAEYNQKLSAARAYNVALELVNNYHIASTRLTYVGKGFSEPVASNDTEDGRSKNRRVEFKVVQ